MTKKIKYLKIEFENREAYYVPSIVIAKHSYETMKKYSKDFDDDKSEYIDFMLTDEYELRDWAINSMDWKDMKDYATKFQQERFNYDKGYTKSKVTHIWDD